MKIYGRNEILVSHLKPFFSTLNDRLGLTIGSKFVLSDLVPNIFQWHRLVVSLGILVKFVEETLGIACPIHFH